MARRSVNPRHGEVGHFRETIDKGGKKVESAFPACCRGVLRMGGFPRAVTQESRRILKTAWNQ